VTRFFFHKYLCILFTLVAAAAAHAEPLDTTSYRQSLQAGVDSGAYNQLAVGWIESGERATWLLGKTARPDIHSRFEIGALTEIFTGLLFAQAALDGKFGQHATLGEVMPQQGFADPHIAGIELDALVTHRAPLPALPPNLFPADIDDPYAGITLREVSAFVANYRTPDLTPRYSPLDVGLLGVAIARVDGGDFDAVLHEKILTPLGMSDTGFGDTGLLDGHSHGQIAAHWHFGALAGSAGLRSTLSDLLDFLQTNLQPQQSSSLRAALLLSRQPRLDTKSQSGLGWNIVDANSDGQTWPLLWRASVTGGFSAFVGFRTDRQQALVLLSDTDADVSRIGLAWLRGDDAPGAPEPSSSVSAPSDAESYAGLYRFSAGGAELVVRAQGGAMTAQLQGSPAVRLREVRDDVFIARGDALTLSFQRELNKVTTVLVNRGVNQLAQRLSAQTPRLTRKVISMRGETLANYAGDYRVDPGTFARVAVDGGGLSLQLTGREAIALAPFAEDRFTDFENSCEVRFERGKDGKVDRITMNFAGVDRAGVREVWKLSDSPMK
jgi:CubicO group peptidase (beta-lactamase class C family)